jgi:DNA-binding transcriptional ArsR family regulator
MARSATTSDAWNAVAEPRRRRILTLLSKGERSVNDVARAIRVKQPQASKHLAVLKQVGLVTSRDAGQQRLYALNGAGLKPIHDWVGGFEHCWNARLDRLERYLQALQAKENSDG